MELIIEVDPSAYFVTELIPVITLQCSTRDRGLIKPNTKTDRRFINPRLHSEIREGEVRDGEVQGTQIHLGLSVDQSYSVSAPAKERFYHSSECKGFAQFFVKYEGGSEYKSIVPGTSDVLADGWITRDFATVTSKRAHADFTQRFVEGLEGNYLIACANWGTSAQKPVSSLYLRKLPSNRTEPPDYPGDSRGSGALRLSKRAESPEGITPPDPSEPSENEGWLIGYLKRPCALE